MLSSTTTKTVSQFAFTILLATAAWLFWQSPSPSPTPPPSIKTSLPANASEDNPQQLWRVITHRVISKGGLHALGNRLNALNINPIVIQHREQVIMHAFDDAELFTNSKMASLAAKTWNAYGISTHIIRADKGVYLLSLGRFYQAVHATRMQQKLKQIDKRYRYQQRIMPIPTWRFTFAPASKQKSEKLWQELNKKGLLTPVLMPEESFHTLYGKHIKPT